jgi:hypothetical protein
MAAAVRYTWMFRTAAVVFLLFGAFALWRYGLTDFQPAQRPAGLAFGGIGIAIGLSALGAGIVCLSATASAPQAKGPVILFLAGLAIVTGLYAALSLRVLLERGDRASGD